MSYNGTKLLPLQFSAASQLERNRLMVATKSTDIVAYATYGSVVDGVSIARGSDDTEDYKIAVQPFDTLEGTLTVSIIGTVTRGDALVSSADGKAKTSDYTVVNATEYDTPSAPSNPSNYIVPADGWSSESGSANKKAVYDGSWTYTTATAGDVAYSQETGKYLVYSGSAWVDAPVVCYAKEAGVSGNDIECYITNVVSQVSKGMLAGGISAGKRIHTGGLFTMTATGASHVINHPDIASADLVFAEIKSSANSVYVTKVVPTANTITVTLSGNVGSAGSLMWLDVKPTS